MTDSTLYDENETRKIEKKSYPYGFGQAFDIGYAQEYGVYIAIILNELANHKRVRHLTWRIDQDLSFFQELAFKMPYLNDMELKKILKKMIRLGLIEKEEINA